MTKFLDQSGLVTLWAQIKALAIDQDELTEALANYKTATELVEILSGYVTDEVFNAAVAELEEKIETEAAKVFTFKGNVATYDDLPALPAIGDVYNIETDDPDNDIYAGDNVVWTGDEWAKLAGSVDLSNYATKAYVDTEVAKKTTQSITGINGEARIENEVSGGGAKFIHTDGTQSYVGVQDGGADGMVAQIYADKDVDGTWIGSRLNVYQKGMFYHNAEDKASEDYVADDPLHEVATIGDVQSHAPDALTEEEIIAICQ